jgi:hypothetical protein
LSQSHAPRNAVLTSTFAALVALAACVPPVNLTPPPAASTAEVVALSGASVMIGAGDIANCRTELSFGTAMLVDSVLRADSIAGVDNVVFTLGDNVYRSGSTTEFATCFAAGWGDTTRRIMAKLRPAPGNHEYLTPGANAYYTYFGAAAGPPGKGYYAYDVGVWRVIVVNSEVIVSSAFGDAARKEQMDWVAKELKDNAKPCMIAYWHNPRFSSGWHGSDTKFIPLWQLLYDNGVDLVLSGHDHNYERFLPMTPAGVLDTAKGITQIVVGTGGATLRGFSTIRPNSAYRIEGRTGVLLLTLGKAEYRSAFLEVGGRIWDQSGGKCH